MSDEEFLGVFKQIINEFRILNEHFDAKTKSKTTDYDFVFSHWTRDMNKRYKGLPINMHWGTSSPQIAKNEILFDVRFKDEYFCEIKYKFDSKFVANFVNSFKEFVEMFLKIMESFNKFNKNFDIKSSPNITDYEKSFSNWKKEVYVIHPDIALDIHWEKKTETISQNSVFINIMMRNDYLFEKKHSFIDEGELLKPISLDAFDERFII